MTRKDAEAVARIYVQASAEAVPREPSHFQVPDAQRVTGRYAKRRIGGEETVLVAERAGEVVGFVDLTIRRSAPDAGTMLRRTLVGFVNELAVSEGRRGNGVGAALMAAAEDWAAGAGAEAIMLDTGTKNTGAIRFYERLGYRPIGVTLIKEAPGD
jgi:GNAT superfamily N-acetyltransferase